MQRKYLLQLEVKLQPSKGCVLLLLYCTIYLRTHEQYIIIRVTSYSLLDHQNVVRSELDQLDLVSPPLLTQLDKQVSELTFCMKMSGLVEEILMARYAVFA